MNAAPDQRIILGLQIFLDHRSLSSIDLLIDYNPQPPPHLPFFDLCGSLEVVLGLFSSFRAICWTGWEEMDGWDGMVIIGHGSSKGTFSANKKDQSKVCPF